MEEVFEDEPGVIMRVMLSAPTGGKKEIWGRLISFAEVQKPTWSSLSFLT